VVGSLMREHVPNHEKEDVCRNHRTGQDRRKTECGGLYGRRTTKAECLGWVRNARSRLVGSDRTVFTVRQGSSQKAANGLEVSVELRGIGVSTR
jgi:hypothetical protein